MWLRILILGTRYLLTAPAFRFTFGQLSFRIHPHTMNSVAVLQDLLIYISLFANIDICIILETKYGQNLTQW